jgi:hypothetical protein
VVDGRLPIFNHIFFRPSFFLNNHFFVFMFPVTKRCIFFQVRESVQASHGGPSGGEVCVQSMWQAANHQALSDSGMEVLYCTFIHRGYTLDVAKYKELEELIYISVLNPDPKSRGLADPDSDTEIFQCFCRFDYIQCSF